MNLIEATMLALQCKLNENSNNTTTENKEIMDANKKLKHLSNSRELVELVDNYLTDNFGIGFPIYLVGKRNHYMLYDGESIDDNRATFLVSDYITKKTIDIHNVYKYYEFSDTYR